MKLKQLQAVVSLLLLSIVVNAQTNTFPSSGSVGIGTTSPAQKLEVSGDAAIAHYGYSPSDGAGGTSLEIVGSGTIGTNSALLSLQHVYNGRKYPFGISTIPVSTYNAALTFFTSTYTGTVTTTERMRISNNGNVGIGTESPTEKLSVNGNISAKKVIATQAGWPDYVFHPSYELRTLSEVEQFIKQNQHLPDVPSAKEVEDNGISLGDNQTLLLKKIEELTLYLIEIKNENASMKAQMEKLKKKVNK